MLGPQPRDLSENILFESKYDILREGTYKGSILTNLKDNGHSIIFSDNIELDKDRILIKGLKVGINGDAATSFDGKFTIPPKDILYSVKIDDQIVKTFEQERFNASFPFMISLLNTHLLFKNIAGERIINHFNFVKGEILNHPIALLYNNSMIVGDRLVIDNLEHPIFYDAFLVSRKAYDTSIQELVEFSYEPIRRLNVKYIKYIIVLGVEMFK
ncbi:MAG: hypothetical protein GF364_08115 [Candidatus Lokiarchaeota archaeon]|nr:hypothetical protein [Candidatus Lokiarchaeota archaeon]